MEVTNVEQPGGSKNVISCVRAFIAGVIFGVAVMSIPFGTTSRERHDISSNKECTILVCSDKEAFKDVSKEVKGYKRMRANSVA